MKSLIAHLGGEKFPRIRVGIGAPGQKEMVGHVLGKFAPDERPLLLRQNNLQPGLGKTPHRLVDFCELEQLAKF